MLVRVVERTELTQPAGIGGLKGEGSQFGDRGGAIAGSVVNGGQQPDRWDVAMGWMTCEGDRMARRSLSR